VAANIYAAASDTVRHDTNVLVLSRCSPNQTTPGIQTFVLAMLCNPKAQQKAQAEIDKVVELVQFEDRDSLPYIDAIVKEILRWHPVLPIGIPHLSTQGDIVGNYFIPEGTIVLGNSWCLDLWIYMY